MEKRACKRIDVSLEGKLKCDDISYFTFVGNISENGLNAIITQLKTTINFTPEAEYELQIQIPSGETLSLHCRKRWSHAISSHGLTKKIGMEILTPPAKYKELLSSLQ